MDKSKDLETNLNHGIQITDRKNLIITGVKKLENFNSEEFFLESVLGYILIKGENLELIKLDTFQGTISIKGKINSCIYLEQGKKQKASEGILAKLFK